jgi:DNA-binding MarR family transcriptional regulator
VALSEAKHPLLEKEPANDRKIVSLSDRDVQDAVRLLSVLAGLEAAAPSPTARRQAGASRAQLVQNARTLISNRAKRSEIFGAAMFGEPAWEMLLALYVAEGGPRQTVSRLAKLSGAPKATALRWMEYLSHAKLIRRELHPTDKRVVFVELTDHGRSRVDAYLSETGASAE